MSDESRKTPFAFYHPLVNILWSGEAHSLRNKSWTNAHQGFGKDKKERKKQTGFF